MLHQILVKIAKQPVAYNFGCRALHNLPWRASVSSYQVQCNIRILRPYCEKICTAFLNYAEILTTCGFVLWCSQIVYIRLLFEHYNRILLCDWVLGRCSVFSFEGVGMPQYFCTLPGLDQGWTQCPTLDVVLYQVLRLVNNSVRKVSVTLLFYLQTRYELFCCVCVYQSALCRLCMFVLYAPNRVFAQGNVRYPVCTCRDPIFNSRDPNRVHKTPQQNPGLSVCYKTSKLNKFTKRYICFKIYLK